MSDRWEIIAGVLFSVLFIGSMVLIAVLNGTGGCT